MQTAQSIIMNCAGIGSRLGLAKTKALINLHGKTLIAWQLEMLKDIKDIRVVVGYQAKEVIQEVSRYRKDCIFVYNHNYFNTKTASSYYLGAKDGNDLAFALDGDLLVHPQDMQKLLELKSEFIAYTDKKTSDAISCDISAKGEVTAFNQGEFEWSGPCCLQKDKIQNLASNIYNQLEPFLPMKGIHVRACDIDTFEDYQMALEIIKEWYEI